jgi:ferric-dicitrate binding protein FerR (iron transport regulator)
MAVVPRQIKTQNGSRSKEILPDGSTVWLNAGSKLVYGKDFGVEIREVHLTGEAFFDIVKNPEKPFVVHAGSIDIRVLGTAFNVRNYPDDKTTETSLLRGSVEITTQKRPGEKWMLKPNEKLVLLKDQAAPSPDRALPKKYSERLPLVVKKELTYQPGDSIAVEMAWVRNKLTFEDESFEEVAKKLERWYDIEIEFRDLVKKDLVLHNTFQNETLEEVMAALEFSLNFRYRIEGRKVIIY